MASTQLSSNQIEHFQREGYLVLPQQVPVSECERMLAITHEHLEAGLAPAEYEAELGYPGAPASRDAPGGHTIRRLREAYQRHGCFRAWAQDPALLAQVQQLLNEQPCLTLAHHNSIMTKQPRFGTATGWHRDIRYWRFARPDLVSVWLALTPEHRANGGLEFIPGSHRLNIAPEQLDELDFLRPDVAANQALYAQGRSIELRPGDVLFFHSGLFHAAGRNTTDALKASLVFAYHGKSNTPLEGSRSAAAGSVCFD